ncbi:MAG: ATPase [Frankiales bacterium]|nr:ATPase [Frankiales bacterium]
MFSTIATDEKGVIQIFNVGAERMYAAEDVVNKITSADISDPDELVARAATLSLELDSSISPGFEALVFKASRGIEDIYELTYVRKERAHALHRRGASLHTIAAALNAEGSTHGGGALEQHGRGAGARRRLRPRAHGYCLASLAAAPLPPASSGCWADAARPRCSDH